MRCSSSSLLLFAIASTLIVVVAAAAAEKRRRLVPPSSSSSSSPPIGNLTVVATKGIWYENLNFDGVESMFASDDMAGKIYRFVRPSGKGMATKTLHLSGFKNTLGIFPAHENAATNTTTSMYAVVGFHSKTKGCDSYAIIQFPTTTPNVYDIVACTPELGNGLTVDEKNRILYTASEVHFIPDLGRVTAIALKTKAVSEFASGLTAADGSYIDQKTGLMYISEVLKGEILVYNVSQASATGKNSLVKKYKAPGCKMVDDYCVIYKNPDGSASPFPYMFAADFWSKKIVAFAASGEGAARVLASNLPSSPTSVRLGRGKGFEGSLFVTEGGGFFSFEDNHNIYELKF